MYLFPTTDGLESQPPPTSHRRSFPSLGHRWKELTLSLDAQQARPLHQLHLHFHSHHRPTLPTRTRNQQTYHFSLPPSLAITINPQLSACPITPPPRLTATASCQLPLPFPIDFRPTVDTDSLLRLSSGPLGNPSCHSFTEGAAVRHSVPKAVSSALHDRLLIPHPTIPLQLYKLPLPSAVPPTCFTFGTNRRASFSAFASLLPPPAACIAEHTFSWSTNLPYILRRGAWPDSATTIPRLLITTPSVHNRAPAQPPRCQLNQ